MEQFNQDKGGGGYFVERVVLTLHLWQLRRASGDQTNSRVFGDRRKAHPSTPRQDYSKTLEGLTDKEVVISLKNRNFQFDRATTINMLETHMNIYLEWFWETTTEFQVNAYEKPSSNGTTHTCQTHLQAGAVPH